LEGLPIFTFDCDGVEENVTVFAAVGGSVGVWVDGLSVDLASDPLIGVAGLSAFAVMDEGRESVFDVVEDALIETTDPLCFDSAAGSDFGALENDKRMRSDQLSFSTPFSLPSM
jgi:hypothetical protein